MQKSVLLVAIQKEIHRHDLSYFVDEPPTVAQPAAANPNPVTGTTTNLSVLGADDGGEANLTYTWSASGPAAVGCQYCIR